MGGQDTNLAVEIRCYVGFRMDIPQLIECLRKPNLWVTKWWCAIKFASMVVLSNFPKKLPLQLSIMKWPLKWSKWAKHCLLPNLWIILIHDFHQICDKSSTGRPGTNNYVELFLSFIFNHRAVFSQTGTSISVLSPAPLLIRTSTNHQMDNFTS